MNSNELNIDLPLVRRLITAQFPQWADLPISPVELGGWDNRTFRLGEAMAVRLPSAERYSAQVGKEQRWLPKLGPHLPLPIPTPIGMGKPADGFPWNWSIYRWIEGEVATVKRIVDLPQFAAALAHFLTALQRIDSSGGPSAGEQNFFRGGSLTVYDAETRDTILNVGDAIDVSAALAVWETALSTSWKREPVWLHGDVSAGNLLIKNGRLSAVIDFGTLGIGDPACDLSIAWTFFSNGSRKLFRESLALDPATWARGRGWTLWKALLNLAESHAQDKRDTPKAMEAKRIIDEVIEEHLMMDPKR